MDQTKLKSIKEYQRKKLIEQIGDQLKLGWIFEKVYEKMILVILCALGFWKLFEVLI